MFSILQRYTFESNSQPVKNNNLFFESCFLSCKDTHLKAIHNVIKRSFFCYHVVFYLAKIHIWKQFTTGVTFIKLKSLLFSILQRYTFESNSQPSSAYQPPRHSCFLSCKDTHLKAIHNLATYPLPWAFVVFYLAKIHIWKQFTTVGN